MDVEKMVIGGACLSLVFAGALSAAAIVKSSDVRDDYTSTKAHRDVNLLRINLVMDEAASDIGLDKEYTFTSPDALRLQNMYGHLDTYTLGKILVKGTDIPSSEARAAIEAADERITIYHKHNWRCLSWTILDHYTDVAFWDSVKFKDVKSEDYKENLEFESVKKGMLNCGVSPVLGLKAINMNMI